MALRPCSLIRNGNVGCLNLMPLDMFFLNAIYLCRKKSNVDVYCIKLNLHLFLSYSIFKGIVPGKTGVHLK